MAIADLDELLVFSQFEITNDIVNLDATVVHGPQKQLVPFWREFSALIARRCVEVIEKWRRGLDIEHGKTVLGAFEAGRDSHLSIGMEGEVLQPVTDLLYDASDGRWADGQVGNQYITQIAVVADCTLAY